LCAILVQFASVKKHFWNESWRRRRFNCSTIDA
jgi:hypothetical protein